MDNFVFGMLFVSSMYHRVIMDNFVFGMLFVSSLFHKVIMDNFFWYAFCVFII